MRRRRLIVSLPQNDYRALERVAEREERTPDQQASFLLRLAVAGAGASPPMPASEAVAREAADARPR
jgi:hypothetical protein